MCPGIQLIEGNHENYIRYHNRIVETVESCVPVALSPTVLEFRDG